MRRSSAQLRTLNFGSAVIERLQCARVFGPYIVLRHGAVYAVYLDRFVMELDVAVEPRR
jgi:hypothetical protein